MKIPVYTNISRRYRATDVVRPGEQKFQVMVEETDLWITLPHTFAVDQARDTVLKTVLELRGHIRAWCETCPDFRHSLVPLPVATVPPSAPDIVRRMDRAARLAGVGPFAAVAGAIAQAVADDLARRLRQQGMEPEVLVENGGDAYLHSRQRRVVALLAMPEEGTSVGLTFAPEDFPLSLCASSAAIGHSLSFGRGDLAVVRSRDGALADAMATAYGNMLKGPDDVLRVTDQAAHDAALGVDGVYAQCAGHIGIWGGLELTALA